MRRSPPPNVCHPFFPSAFGLLLFQHNLEEQAKKPPEEKLESAEPERESKHQSIAQIIYAANRVRSEL